MDGQRANSVVIDKALLPELVHKVIDPRPGRADHLGQVVMYHSGNGRSVFAILTPMSQDQENASQAFFAGIKDLVHIILFDSSHLHHQV